MSESSAVSAVDSDPGPGPLRLIQSFASTRGAEPGSDHLRVREEAAAWLHTTGLLPAETGLTNSEHAALLRLRDAIRDVLAAHTKRRADAEAAARLTKALADGRLILTVDHASAIRLASAARASYPHVVAAFAVAIAESAGAGTWPRLKTCTAPRCGRVFYDDSSGADARRCSTHVIRRLTTVRSS